MTAMARRLFQLMLNDVKWRNISKQVSVLFIIIKLHRLNYYIFIRIILTEEKYIIVYKYIILKNLDIFLIFDIFYIFHFVL